MLEYLLIVPLVAAFKFVEQEFPLPEVFSRQVYDIELSDPLPETDDRIEVLVNGGNFTCTFPKTVINSSIASIPDNDTIRLAQQEIAKFHDKQHTYFDDVWGWRFEYDTDVRQFLPARYFKDTVMHVVLGGGFVSVGEPSSIEGENLNSTKPVFVDDKYMMLAHYKNGHTCDLTMQPREAKLYFTCDSKLNDTSISVLNAAEPQSNCIYEFVLGIKGLCKFPQFSEQQVSASPIRCDSDMPLFQNREKKSLQTNHYEKLKELLSSNYHNKIKQLNNQSKK
ncbi:hypothetical protein DASB73_042850 [Starmerella bacillaris]|uniref:Endoplasmic reticulum lectin n=1 Tax=Starmerella bacillaris TaxID=1247836 RepID=A0AAV5RQB9_STABA|nr:hypothetical protein DASB73_042850 [Starmerella bacillaris]